MITIGRWIIDNWQLFTTILVLFIVLALTGRLKKLLSDARKGLAELFTIDGFLIFCGLAYLIYLIYMKVAPTL